jgi:rare lipoprotein A
MQKHFAVAIVAISTILATLSGTVSARASARSHAPAAPDNASHWVGETGTASYYGPVYHGRRAANGARFDQEALTAAHPWLPFGTKVKVTLATTGRTVVVTITDRIFSSRRIVDLSVAAARQLGMISQGIARVTLLPV